MTAERDDPEMMRVAMTDFNDSAESLIKPVASRSLAVKLQEASTVLMAAIASDSSLVTRFKVLRERLQQNRLQLAVLGQFKRGKSTFINALLGAPLLPIAVVPLTAVPIFISWRPEPLVRVRFSDERTPEELASDEPDAIREFLFRFVAEAANPENRLGVDRVDLFYPASILANGTVLIDTPGVGSTLRHNTDAALRVLPECDAVIFIVSADPPITETELDYLRRLIKVTTRIFFVLNKIDYLAPDERKSVGGFLRKVLSENAVLRPDVAIFDVSARDGLLAKQARNRAQLEASGIATIEEHLVRYLAAEKTKLLETAITSKARDILLQAEAEIDLHIRALKMPLEELTSKSHSFEAALRSIEDQRRVTRDLITGEQRRLRESLESCIKKLRGEASSKVASVIDAETMDAPNRGEETALRAISAAMEKTFDAARQEVEITFSDKTSAVLAAHQHRIDSLIDGVRRTAADIFKIPFVGHFENSSFELGEEPYWVTKPVNATLIPDPSHLVDRLLPKQARAKRRRERIIRHIKDLVLRNAENLRWAILRGMDETFRDASAKFEEQLDDAIMATKNVISESLALRRDRLFAAGPDLDRLNWGKGLLSTARAELVNGQGKSARGNSRAEAVNESARP
jgi:predicted GTPase